MSTTTIRIRQAGRVLGNKVTATVKKLLLIALLCILIGVAFATGFILFIAHVVQ